MFVFRRHTSSTQMMQYYVKIPSLVRRFRRPTNIQITLESERRRRRISLGHYARRRQPEQVVFGCKSHRKSDGRQKRLHGDRPCQLPNYFHDVTIIIILYTRDDDDGDAWQTLSSRSIIRLRRYYGRSFFSVTRYSRQLFRYIIMMIIICKNLRADQCHSEICRLTRARRTQPQMASRSRESAPLTPLSDGRWRDGSEKTTSAAAHRLPQKVPSFQSLVQRSISVVLL